MTPPSGTPKEPLRRAVALRYERAREDAPRVVAQGQGCIAEAILAFASAHGIPVHQDRDMVELLSACELGEEISPELYEVVARLLAFLYRANERIAREEQAAGAPEGERA